MARHDRRTGIERVSRAIAGALSGSPPTGFRVEATEIVDDSPAYARRFQADVLGLDVAGRPAGKISASAGDHYVLLDWTPDRLPALEDWLHEFRTAGGIVTVVVYDLLPLERPDFFPDWLRHTVSDWLRLILRIADRVACISRDVADGFARATRFMLPVGQRPISIGYFHLGFDLGSSSPTLGSDSAEKAALATIGRRPTFLMVGTVEPRKGHAQIVEAFDALWASGLDIGLIVVGKAGWMVDDVSRTMRTHPRAGDSFFWFERASDETLTRFLDTASALIVASEAEGFGLPLVEAAHHGLPIIARDIPVFREVAGDHATYFTATTGAEAAEAIRAWIDLPANQRPTSAGMPRLTWAQAAEEFSAVVLGRKDYLRSSSPVGCEGNGGVDPHSATPYRLPAL